MKLTLPFPQIKLHNKIHNNAQNYISKCQKVRNLLHNKIYSKIDFSLCFGFAKQAKIRVYSLN